MPNNKYKPYEFKLEIKASTESDMYKAINKAYKEITDRKGSMSVGYSGWYNKDEPNEVDVRWNIYDGLDL
jgi:hypothetical protein